MHTRKLGNKIDVSAIGYGSMGLSHGFGPSTDRTESIRLIREALEAGYTFFDTAEIYGPYINEEIVGEALKPYRDQVVIATKFGITSMDDKTDEMVLDSSPKKIRGSVNSSLKRLGIETIDVYYQHRPDPNTPVEEVAETMGELIKEGKIKGWGLSGSDVDSIRRAHAITPLTAVQEEHSIMYRHLEKDVLPVLEELGISLVAYSPLAKGFLTGTITEETSFEEGDLRGIMARYKPEVMKANQALLDFMTQIADEKGATLAQVSLAWLLARNPIVVPIPGSRNVDRIRENAGAAYVTITPEEYARINELLNKLDILQIGFY